MAMQTDISDVLAEQREQTPEELQHLFLQLEDYWERKLWHELTEALLQFFKHPASRPQRRPLYDTFIKSFASKINQLKLVTLGMQASMQYKDDHERLDFLYAVAKSVNNPASQDAFVYATIAVAAFLLHMEELDEAQVLLQTCGKILDTFDSVETVVHASFYRTNATYHKAKNEFAPYYRNALLYLACVDVAELVLIERQTRAYELSVAALMSESIYNFGELLLHPILDSLIDTQQGWLRDLLFAYNRGDIGAYESLSSNFAQVRLLRENHHFLYQKMLLSALTEAVFRRPPHDRTMDFATISQETGVPPKDVEHLVMKALSLGLLRGTIDQVSRLARINWVQPKVLDRKQIESMRFRLRDWDSSVNNLGNWIEGQGKDVWAA